MSKIAHFFETIGHDIKVAAKDVAGFVAKIFGPQALAQLETTAETLLKSELGQAVLSDAETLLLQVRNGQISQATAISSLAHSTINEAKKTGIDLETSIATALAALSIGKLSGALNAPTAATQAAVEKALQPAGTAAPADPKPEPPAPTPAADPTPQPDAPEPEKDPAVADPKPTDPPPPAPAA